MSFIYAKEQISLTSGRLQIAHIKIYLFGKGKKVEKEGFAMEGPGYKNHANTNADHIFAWMVNNLHFMEQSKFQMYS